MNIKRFKEKRALKIFLKICILLIVLTAAIEYGPNVYKRSYAFAVKVLTEKKIIVIGETTVRVEMADTYEKRTAGLSGRKALADQTGMFFVFEKPGLYGIWMKDMHFDLDIIWFNTYREVIYIVESATPESYPDTFLPPTSSKYILEVPAGFVKKHGIKTGDIFDFY